MNGAQGPGARGAEEEYPRDVFRLCSIDPVEVSARRVCDYQRITDREDGRTYQTILVRLWNVVTQTVLVSLPSYGGAQRF